MRETKTVEKEKLGSSEQEKEVRNSLENIEEILDKKCNNIKIQKTKKPCKS